MNDSHDHEHEHSHEHEHGHEHSRAPATARHVDVAVVGGSAAGLAAALQLSRQRRSVIVIDAGEPRNAPAAAMHSYLGHEGRAPSDFLDIARDEVRSYGVEVLRGRVVAVRAPDPAGRAGRGTSRDRAETRFEVEAEGGLTVHARRVIAATGQRDELPDVPGLAEHWGGAVIHCPFCHGYEARDQRIVALVTSPTGLHPLPLLRQLTDQLTVVLHAGVAADAAELDALRAAGTPIIATAAERVLDDDAGGFRGLRLVDGTEVAADTMLVGTRLHAQVAPFSGSGLDVAEHPSGVATVVEADPMTGATAVPGLYAAGTLSEPVLQVLPTAAAGSRVGSMVAFDLAHADLEEAARPVAHAADWEARYSGDRQWSGNPNGTLVAEATGLEPGTALDVGAGEGGDALWLAGQGWQVTATDISGRALERVSAAATRHGVDVAVRQADANARDPFRGEQYDLVTAAYASLPRTPDGRGAANLLDAVAPGGLLLVINHDLADMLEAGSNHGRPQAFDPRAFVQTDDLVAAINARDGWEIEVHERRSRPPGAVSTHHVNDVVLRARRRQ